MKLLESDPSFMEAFQQAGCLFFFQKLQGYHTDVAHQFSINYDGVKSRVGPLEIPVSEQAVVVATGIPAQGERWLKGMALYLAY